MKKKTGRYKLQAQNWEQFHDRQLGRRPHYEYVPQEAGDVGDPACQPNGILLGHSSEWAWVQYDGKEIFCRIDGRVFERRVATLAPGDAVRVEWEGDEPMLRGVAPRRSQLSRRLPRGKTQVVAANIDVLVVVTTPVQPRFKAGVVDRYLIAAELGGVRPVLCLNKIDLADEEPEAIQQYRDLGVPVVRTSCETGEGLDELRAHLAGRLSVLAGQSGVGKSSLINALDPAADIRVQEVSNFTGKGRHTTRRGWLYELSGDIRIIDTPGVRQMAVHGVTPEEADLYFPEIAELAINCRFRNCRHQSEPNCAVRKAVEEGTLSNLRYQSYVHISDSLEED